MGVVLLYLADITEFERTPIARTTSIPVPVVVDITNAAAAVTVAVTTNHDVNTQEKTDEFEELDWDDDLMCQTTSFTGGKCDHTFQEEG